MRAVDGASFTLEPGRTLGIVGESGCGKSVTARSILRIVERPGRIEGGEIWLRRANGEPRRPHQARPAGPAMREIRGGEIGLVFQEPMTSFSAYHTVGNQIIEAIRLHSDLSKTAARERAIELLRMVGVPQPQRRIDEYAFELSGGLRQRVMIAMALVGRAAHPDRRRADHRARRHDPGADPRPGPPAAGGAGPGRHPDHPRHGRDRRDGRRRRGHVSRPRGREGPGGRDLPQPAHPYTRSLLRSIPSIMAEPRSRLLTIAGSHPAPLQPAQGLPLPSALPRLHARHLRPVVPGAPPRSAPRHEVSCFLYPADRPAVARGRLTHAARPSSRSSSCRNGSRSAAACCAGWSAMCGRSTMSASTSARARRSRWSANSGCGKTTTSRCILRALTPDRRRDPLPHRGRPPGRRRQAAEDGAAAAAAADADDLPGPVLVAQPAHDDHGHHRRAAAGQRHARPGGAAQRGCASCWSWCSCRRST